jgi:hypothetical protein
MFSSQCVFGPFDLSTDEYGFKMISISKSRPVNKHRRLQKKKPVTCVPAIRYLKLSKI